jgi:uncharacterized protein
MNSCLYECTVMHRRITPKPHAFTNRIFMFLLDLDELDEIAARVPLFSVNSPNLYALRDEDYFRFHSRGIRANVTTFLQSRGIDEAPASIALLTLPRLLGYTFNPVSIFFCHRADGSPLAAVIQVGNTFGELKPYLVPPSPHGFHARLAKNYYVSPFSNLDPEFDFLFDPPAGRLQVVIDEFEKGQKILASSLVGSAVPLTTSNLAALTLRFPLVTLKVITLIHWQALRLWLKGVPHRRKEPDPQLQQDAFRTKA